MVLGERSSTNIFWCLITLTEQKKSTNGRITTFGSTPPHQTTNIPMSPKATSGTISGIINLAFNKPTVKESWVDRIRWDRRWVAPVRRSSGSRATTPEKETDTTSSAPWVSKHGRTNLVTRWSGQNSGGIGSAQANALTDQVNLYGWGDVVLQDKGNRDVAMWGQVTILNITGSESGKYAIPRSGVTVLSQYKPADYAFAAGGKFKNGLDFGGVEFEGGAAIVLKQNQKISFASPGYAKVNDEWYSKNIGTTWIDADDTYLNVVAGNRKMFRVSGERSEFRPERDGIETVRIYGSNPTSFLAMGQSGIISYVSAMSAGQDNGLLAFRTAQAGQEADRLVILADGTLDYKKDAIAANNVSNFSPTKMIRINMNGQAHYIAASATPW